MAKLSFEEWKNSMSFMIDDDFDNRFLSTIEPLALLINRNCQQFSNPILLSNFLTAENEFRATDKLKAFISLIGLSEERLKRVTSLIRYRIYGEEFRTEWDVRRISREMQINEQFKDLLINFFIVGRRSEIGREIPLYYMRNFKLNDEGFIRDLENFNYVDRILNDNEIQGKYSNCVGAHVEQIIQAKLNTYRELHNQTLIYDIQREYHILNKNIDILIPSVDSPVILIESSYNITTGSGQSKRADQLVDFYSTLMRHNANHRNNRILMLNYCDGFGWVGRQNDLHRIYDASDFVFNQQNLNVLDEVLNAHYPPALG